MKKQLSKSEAKERIEGFFRQTEELNSEDVRKIKRLAMKHNIKLQDHRKRFCRKCYSDLRKYGKTRIKNIFKSVECLKCGEIMRWKVK